MQLSEGLDELRVGILRDSSTLKSGPPDAYWTDARLVRYIDDAHKRFARLSLCIHDDVTPEVVQVPLASAIDTYTLHPSVLYVITARHQDDTVDLRRITHNARANTTNPYTELTFDFAMINNAGKPTQFSTDEGLDPTISHAIRMVVAGVPDTTQDGKIVYLRTIRKPLVSLSLDATDTEFEIPEEYHLDMLEWAAYRALRNWDVDGEDRQKSVQHKDRFNEAVAECRKDVRRKLWAPLSWGFGQAGFSYIKNN